MMVKTCLTARAKREKEEVIITRATLAKKRKITDLFRRVPIILQLS